MSGSLRGPKYASLILGRLGLTLSCVRRPQCRGILSGLPAPPAFIQHSIDDIDKSLNVYPKGVEHISYPDGNLAELSLAPARPRTPSAGLAKSQGCNTFVHICARQRQTWSTEASIKLLVVSTSFIAKVADCVHSTASSVGWPLITTLQ